MSLGELAFPHNQITYPPALGACPYGLAPYAIRPGDTLWELARETRSTVESIMRHNPGLDPCNLPVGRVICLPYEAVAFPGYSVRH